MKGLERKTATAAEALTAPASLEEKIDRYGDLQVTVEKLGAQIENARVKVLREKISEANSDMAALREEIEKECTVNLGDQDSHKENGARYFVQIGKCAMKRAINNMKKTAELIGLDNFFELATFPLGSIDDYLTPKEREQVLDVSHDGARSFKVKPRKA